MKYLLVFCLIVMTGKNYAQSGFGSIAAPVSEHYRDTVIDGWKLKVNARLLEDHRLITSQAEGILSSELQSIEKLLPSESIPYLKEMPIWLEFSSPNNKSIQFHFSSLWLKRNGYDPGKESCVEIVVADYVNMPHDSLPLLRMMGFAYEHRVLGLKNKDIDEAYKLAKGSGLYTMQAGRKKVFIYQSYMDYFASLSAAYFGGKLAYAPYNREKLKETDPKGYELVEKLWKVHS